MTNIVLLVQDRPRLTRQTLESLAQTPDITLTIVDDRSEIPEMREMIRLAMCQFAHVQLVRHFVPQGVGGSRNDGASRASERFGRGDYLYFSDNDIFACPGWLNTLQDVLDRFPIAKLVGGQCHPFNAPNRLLGRIDGYSVTSHDAVDGLSWLMTWDTWDTWGPFKSDGRGPCQSEDYEMCQRIRKDGFEVTSVFPHVVLNCGRTNSLGKLIPGAELACKSAEQKGVIVE